MCGTKNADINTAHVDDRFACALCDTISARFDESDNLKRAQPDTCDYIEVKNEIFL